MADSQGLSPGDTGYDASSDPYWGIAYGGGSLQQQDNAYGAYYPQADPSTSAPPANPSAAPTTPPASTTTPAATGAPDYSSSAGQLAAVTQWLQGAGWGGQDPNYWMQRINQTGGFTDANIGYWQQRIAAGQAGEQPGGAYYEAPGSAAGPTPPGTPADALQQLPSQSLSLPSFKPAPAFTPATFTPTTLSDMMADPGYQFRVDQGENQLQQSAAARGVLNSGGTLKDILDYGQNAASQEFQNVDARRISDFNTQNQSAMAAYNANNQTQTVDPYTYAYQAAKDAFSLPNDEALKAFSTIWSPALGISAQY